MFCPKEEPVTASAAASGLVAPKFKAGTGRLLSVPIPSVADPGSGSFLSPGSGIGFYPDQVFIGSRIPNPYL